MKFSKILKTQTIGILIFMISLSHNVMSQAFPNPATLSTGQGPIGTIDPLWLVSPWYAGSPPNSMGLPYSPTLINNNCAPGAWVDPTTLPFPSNNGNWITGDDGNCAVNTNSGYRYFRLTLNLPAVCNGLDVTQPGNYILNLDGYSDNAITDVAVNGASTGISGGGFGPGNQLNINLVGPWLVGVNYVDVLVWNQPSPDPADVNPYGLLMVASSTSNLNLDTDNDGVPNLTDACPCDPGTNVFGCNDPVTNGCDIDAIRQAFTSAGCIEIPACMSDCSMYFLNPQSLSGTGAQAFAQTLGSNLISIQNAAENQCIINNLNTMGAGGVIWIGFNDEAVEGTFEWYDQSPVSYTNWAPGEPNSSGDEDYVQIYSDGSWNDLAFAGAATSVIEVNLCPVITTTPDFTICVGQNATMSATTILGSFPYTYTWSDGAAGASNTVTPTATTNYTVTVTDRYNCAADEITTVNVNDLPIISAGNYGPFCIDAADVTLAGTPAGGTFSGTGVTIDQFDPSIGTQVITYDYSDANGCASNTTTTIIVNPLPIVAFNVNDPCRDFSSDFINTSSTPSTSAWDFNDAGTSSVFSPSHVYSAAGTYNVTLTITDANNCVSSLTQPAIVHPKPDALFSVAPVCVGLNSDFIDESLVAAPDNITNWNWIFGNNTTSTAQNPSPLFASENIYTDSLIVTTNNGCKDTLMLTNTVWPKPNVDYNVTEACLNFANSFSSLNSTISNLHTANNIASWNYTFGDGNGSNLPNPDYIYANDGLFASQLVLTSNNNCKDSIQVQVTVHPKPDASFVGVDLSGCSPICPSVNSTSVINAPGVNSIYNWLYSDGFSESGVFSARCFENPTSATQTYGLTLFVTSDKGCKDTATDPNYIQVYHLPIADFDFSPGDPSIIDNIVEFENLSSFATTYQWTLDDLFTSTQFELTYTFPFEPTIYEIELIAITDHNCRDTIQKPIRIKDVVLIHVPNTFTPDGNEYNNVFKPIVASGIDPNQYSLFIFNRWGEMVFESNDYSVGWDGTYNGKMAQSGTYTWKIQYKLKDVDEREELVGHVNLSR